VQPTTYLFICNVKYHTDLVQGGLKTMFSGNR